MNESQNKRESFQTLNYSTSIRRLHYVSLWHHPSIACIFRPRPEQSSCLNECDAISHLDHTNCTKHHAILGHRKNAFFDIKHGHIPFSVPGSQQ